MKIPIRELMKVHFYAEAGTESEIAIERIAFNCVCDIVGASDCVSTSYLKVTQTTFSWHRLTSMMLLKKASQIGHSVPPIVAPREAKAVCPRPVARQPWAIPSLSPF